MADVERSVRIAFQGDDQITPVINGITGSMDAFASKVQGVTGPLADMAAAVLKAEAAFAALAAAGITVAVKAAGEFDTQFREIQTLFDTSPENVSQFKTALLDFASSSLTPLDQVTRATYEAISAGINWTEAIGFMSQAEKLNVAGKGELQSTTLALAGVINAYGGDVSKAADYSDVLFQTVKIGNVVLPQLADGLGKVVAIAAAGGVPFADLGAAVAALTAYGVPAEEAMTAVQRAIISIISPSQEAKAQAEALGISFDAEALKANGLQGMLQLIYEKTGGNVDQINNLIPRVEGLVAVLTLGKDAGGKYAEALQAMEDRAGAVAKAYEIMAESFDKVNQRIVNSLQATLIAIGMPLLDEYAQIGNGISAIFSNLKVEVDKGTFDPVLNLVQEFGSKLATDLQAIAKVMPEALAGVDWTKLTDSIRNLGGEVGDLFRAVFGDIDLTTVDGLRTAIQKVVDAIAALTNVTAGILNSWEPFLAALGKAATEFSNLSPEAQETTGGILGFGQAIDKILDNISIFTSTIRLIGIELGVLNAVGIFNLIKGMGSLTLATEATVAVLAKFSLYALAPIAGYTLGNWLYDNVPLVKEYGDSLGEAVYNLTSFTEGQVSALESGARTTEELGREAVAAVRLAEAMGELPDQKQIEFSAIDRASPEFKAILEEVQKIPTERNVDVSAKADTASIEETKRTITTTIMPDGLIVMTNVRADQSSIESTKTAIGTIPDKKIVEMTLQGEIDRQLATIKANADTVQAAMRWQAEIEITSIKEAEQTLRTFSDNTTKMFLDTGDVISAALGQLSKLEGLDKYHVEDIIKADLAIRQALAESQIKMNNFQMEYIKARTDAMNRGDGMITINAQGLEPELELVLHKIIELTQIKANEEGLAFLLGV
jgi:TP901 family phage tail tape measure protein